MNARQQEFEHRKRRDDRGYRHEDLVFEKRSRRETSTTDRLSDPYESYENDRWSYEEDVYNDRHHHHPRHRENEQRDKEESQTRRCLECESFPGAVKCSRCCNQEGQHQPEIANNLQDVDEFGRSKKPQKAKIQWPPPFEKSGSAFVLDYRMGMFHEAKSDFFYDPKTKLYFSNNNRVYYTYNTETQRFEEAEKSTEAALDPMATSSTDLMPIMDNAILPGKNDTRKTISIKLTTKTMSNRASKPGISDVAQSKVAKKHAVDMAKWSVRQTEKQSKTERKLIRTVKGEPVCLACRRKFQSVESLRRHETSSQLHKTTTLRLQESKYADRAQQRRELHDEFDSTALKQTSSVGLLQSTAVHQQDSTTSPVASVQIGEAMLRKIGWTENDKNPKSTSALRQEWSRIEAVASNKKKDASTSQPLGLGAK